MHQLLSQFSYLFFFLFSPFIYLFFISNDLAFSVPTLNRVRIDEIPIITYYVIIYLNEIFFIIIINCCAVFIIILLIRHNLERINIMINNLYACILILQQRLVVNPCYIQDMACKLRDFIYYENIQFTIIMVNCKYLNLVHVFLYQKFFYMNDWIFMNVTIVFSLSQIK